MPASSPDSRRRVIHHAVRGLAQSARAERAIMARHAPERQFSLGVEAAAEDLLHPERADTRPPGWLDREPAAFRDGYVRTQHLLAAAVSAKDPPLSLRPPEFHRAER